MKFITEIDLWKNYQWVSNNQMPKIWSSYSCSGFKNTLFYASTLRRWRHMFSGCPSVRPKPEITSFHLYMGPLVHPTKRDRFAACPSIRPSVRPERFPGICRRMHEGNGLKFCMLMYLGHLQNWFDYGHGLLIFLLLVSLWLSEKGQIWGFRTFPRERIVGMAWIFACWCILTTFKID